MRHLYGTTALAGRIRLPSLSGGGSAVAPNAWEDKLKIPAKRFAKAGFQPSRDEAYAAALERTDL